ncbi:phage antirepressor KilAC domain-containing protein [Lactobacillus sp. ESL0684]|uniref:phage antirepressor KilAC domain-containing protein n=1 Tax=unclassified Lactobacillus TaxID=2620435 RepID=UPI0023F73D12|nr:MULTISPECIES: phage antirepressor KilAC domain-containing protein [unclassified Lactobacillus]WEV40319.1 phage antirepressor KilAC domain-containing protein [Lactobacillus sp. ESL0681]WEV42998.1 phage antirepressor KilAC domain-containing protein [Lactobacillus sp. ESL0684]
MQELIKVQVKGDQQLVSARDLHKGLGLTTRFSKWVEQNFKDFEEDVDFTTVTTVTDMPNGGTKPLLDYALTIDMAKQLCLLSRTEKGKQYRKYLIEVEKKWNDPAEIVKRGYAILQDENNHLKIENEKMKPKAIFADAVSTSKATILIGQLAKILRGNGVNIGQNRLFAWLREHGYLIKKRGRLWNTPTQWAIDHGWFKVREKASSNPDGSTYVTYTTMVTGEGQKYFINKLLGSEQMELV